MGLLLTGGEGKEGERRERRGREGKEGKGKREGRGWGGTGALPLLILQFNHWVRLVLDSRFRRQIYATCLPTHRAILP